MNKWVDIDYLNQRIVEGFSIFSIEGFRKLIEEVDHPVIKNDLGRIQAFLFNIEDYPDFKLEELFNPIHFKERNIIQEAF